ncbi:MAG: hypothetical protein U5N58_13885 [Actinomycetota bacterium]|nr:hypothetical protein [Actinomycetota bacterium]
MVKRIYFPKIESTNNYAVENIENIEDRTVILADEQTKGKGRNWRYWVSEKDNLFASLVLKPQFDFCQIYTYLMHSHIIPQLF